MHVGEQKLTLEEYRNSGFEPFQAPPFWDALDDEFLAAKEIGHVLVLDLTGALTGAEAQEFHVRIQRLVEHGEQIVVVNLKALTSIDSMGLGVLVRSIVTLKSIDGTMPLVNAPKHFRDLLTIMKFL